MHYHIDISSAVPFASVFPFRPRSLRYEVEDISSRVKRRDRTEGGNASAPLRAPCINAVAHGVAPRIALARIDFTRLKISTDEAARDLLIFSRCKHHAPGHFNAELRTRSAEAWCNRSKLGKSF